MVTFTLDSATVRRRDQIVRVKEAIHTKVDAFRFGTVQTCARLGDAFVEAFVGDIR